MKNIFRQYLDNLKDIVVVIQNEKVIFINKIGKYTLNLSDDVLIEKFLSYFDEESKEKILLALGLSQEGYAQNDFDVYLMLNKVTQGFCKLSKIFIDKKVAYLLNIILLPQGYKILNENDIKIKGEVSSIKNIAGGIAHNFNNALASMSLAVETLKFFIEKTPKAIDLLDKILRLSLKMAKWTNQLLSYARLGKYISKELDINEVILNAIEEINENKPNEIDIVHKFEKNLIPVKGDPTQLKKAFMEIIQNGVEAINEKGRVLIISKQLIDEPIDNKNKYKIRPCVKITIQDNGCGMDKEIMSRIYEPFFSTKFQGRGLGLSAAYGVIDNHGGDIYVESELEKGSKFDVFLPCVAENQNVDLKSTQKTPENQYVLIIDSDDNMQFILKSILESYEYKVLQSHSLVDALSISKTDKKFKLIFLNTTTIPNKELLIFSYIQSNQPESKTMVLMNYGDAETKSALSGLNISRIVHQPFDQNELVEEIIEILR